MTLHLNTTQDIGHGVTVMLICFTLIDFYTDIRNYRKVDKAWNE